MGNKPALLRTVAAGVLAWPRGERRPGSDENRSVLPATGTNVLGKEAGAKLEALEWNDSSKSVHPVIDQQHGALFEIAHDLLHAVDDRRLNAYIESLLQDAGPEPVSPVRAACANPPRIAGAGARAERLVPRRQVGGQRAVAFIAYDVIADHVLNDDGKSALRNDRRSSESLSVRKVNDPGSSVSVGALDCAVRLGLFSVLSLRL